jgi:hypothetical protein
MTAGTGIPLANQVTGLPRVQTIADIEKHKLYRSGPIRSLYGHPHLQEMS